MRGIYGGFRTEVNTNYQGIINTPVEPIGTVFWVSKNQLFDPLRSDSGSADFLRRFDPQ